MGRKKKKRKKQSNQASMPPLTFKLKARRWWQQKNPAVFFILSFFIVIGAFYAVYSSSGFKQNVFPKVVEYNAIAASKTLNLMGFDTQTSGDQISNPQFSVTIKRGCDALEPIGLLLAIMIAFPIAWRLKIPGLIVGSITLLAVNVFRVVTLFLAGLYSFQLFDTMHVMVWQFLFILITLVCCAVWINWATNVSIKNDSN